MLGTRNMSSLISASLTIIKQVELNSTFLDKEENRNRMIDYFFPGFARKVINSIHNYIKNGKSGSLLISGRPGFGKTHLMLFLANFFNLTASDSLFEEMVSVAGDFPLKKIKDDIGRFLVVNPLPLKESGTAKFDSALNTAINGALAREAIDFMPEAVLSARVTIEETADYLKRNTDCKGIVILMDNFEPALSDLENEPDSPLAQQVKYFFESLRVMEKMPVIFIGAGSFLSSGYATFDLEQDLIKVVAKYFDELQWFNYEDEDWVKFVTTKILQHISPEALTVLTSNPEFEKLARFIIDAGMYKDIGMKYVQNELLPGCFPLHPFTMKFLPGLSQKISIKDKNLLAFFRDTSPGSLRYFLDTFGIFQASGRLSVYTPDYLFSYYERTIKDSTALKNVYNAVEKAYMLSGNLPLARRVIRLVALMQIIDDEEIRPTKTNIIESLHVMPRDRKKFEPMLIEMVHKGGFFYNRETQEIKLPVQKTGINLKDYIDKRLGKIKRKLHPNKILNEQYKIKEINAEKYNLGHRTDRKVWCQFIDLNDLKSRKFARQIKGSLGKRSGRYLGDVAVLFLIICDDDELIDARNILISEPEWDSDRVVIAVPVRPVGFLNMLYEKEALLEIREDEPPFNKEKSAERELLENRLEEVERKIDEKLSYYRRPDRLYWYYRQNLIKQMQEKTLPELADALMEETFYQFPVIPDPIVSSFKDKKIYKNIRRDVVEKILGSVEKIRLPVEKTTPQDRIMDTVLIKTGIMEKVVEKKDFQEYLVISEPLQLESPLKEIWNYLYQAIIKSPGEGRKILQMSTILDPLLRPPYGLNPALLEVLMAAIFRNYTSEVDIFKNFREMQETGRESVLKRMSLDYSAIRAMSLDPGDYLVYFTEFPAEEKLFVNKFIEMFTRVESEYSETPLWGEGKKAILDWFDRQSEMTKKNRSYVGKYTLDFIDLIQGDGKDALPRDFFRELLPVTLGYNLREFSFRDKALKMLQQIKSIYVEITRYSQLKQVGLWKAVKMLFACREGKLVDKFRKWRKSVPDSVKIEQLSKDAAILMKVNPGGKLKEQFLLLVPDKMGFKPFNKWESDRTLEYLARLSKAKLEIDVSNIISALKIPEKKEPKEQVAREILERVFEEFQISDSEKEVYIVDLMEKMIW
ncbi:MAG: hypothetical protein K8T10_03170 [Candidatus Eremiobacteraeota bacterium]|nr:hypothetical protein [Candidatus Eremiobacteraeota bacterium]